MRSSAMCITIAPLALIASGCASIVGGQNQSLSVETRVGARPVMGAACHLKNNKGEWFVTSPGSVTVSRSYDDLVVTCELAGHSSAATAAKSATKGMAFGNILAGGLIGAAVDMHTGSAYDYPSIITVRLTQLLPDPAAVSQPIAEPPTATISASPAPPATSTQAVDSKPIVTPATVRTPQRPKWPPGYVIIGPH